MFPYFYETKIVEDGKLLLQNLPFIDGDKVDIILMKHANKNYYSLRGTNFKYINPTEPVAENDWEAIQ
ncbi:MAG: hypothetical protein HW421_4067 [Ignavibacteria bacterium]|nr:hypothetical protein [Ignavibacteria bacterium]